MRIASAALTARFVSSVSPSLCLASIFLVIVFAYQCTAQTTVPVPPHTLAFRSAPPPKSESQEQFIPYWTAESGWHTELMLRNNLASRPLTVTPALRLDDGTELALVPVDIAPGTVASVNLHDDLMKAHPEVMNLASLYGSVVLRYTSPSDTNLFASVMVHDEGHPIMFHLDGTYSVPSHGSGDREGIWWLPRRTTHGYLILSNMSEKEQSASLLLYDPAGTPWKQALTLPPKQTIRLSVPDLISRTGWSTDHGGLSVQMPEGTGRVSSALILYDETTGFSATMKMFDWDPAITLKSHDYAKTGKWTTRAAMLALEYADPALQLPAHVILHPQLFIHNIATHPVEAQLSLHWRSVDSDVSAEGRVQLPTMTLAPFETRIVNIKQLQDSGTVPPTASWAQVTLTTNSLPGEVVAVASSFDDTLRYGAQTPFSDQLAFHLEGGSWRVDANHNSIIAAGNGGSKPVKARVTFFYAGGTKRYEIERTIPADDQMWIDMGKLIRNGIPDIKGTVLPSDLNTGAYQLLNLDEKPQPVLYEGKVVTDKTYGHATYGCMICCGFRTLQLNPDPLSTILFGSVGFTPVGTNSCSGQKNDLYSYVGSWWSDNTTIMTVNPGQATGASVGSTNLNVDMPNLPARGILYGTSCPIQDMGASGAGNVRPVISITNLQYTNSLSVWQDGPSNPNPIAMSQTVWTKSANYPSVFAAGKSISATATFSVNPVSSAAITGASITGNVAGFGQLKATGITIPAGVSSVNVNFSGNSPFPASTTQHYSGLGVAWFYSQTGQTCSSSGSPESSDCQSVGSTSSPVYVTLAPPSGLSESVMPLTAVKLAIGSGGAMTQTTAWQNTWRQFAGPANVTGWDGRSLYYYKQGVPFSACATSSVGLLTLPNGSGQCGSWARLLMDALAVNGISSSFTTVTPNVANEMLVKNWSFSASPTYPSNAPWEYKFTPVIEGGQGYGMVPLPSNSLFGDLTSISGLPGENSPTPSEKFFVRHFVVKAPSGLSVGGPYFDPSYGAIYSNACSFESVAVAGYANQIAGTNNFYVEKPAGACNVTLVP